MPRKDHHKKTQNKLNVKLRSDNINISEIKKIVKKLIKERKSFLSRQLNRNEIFAKYYELENSNLNKLETQIELLISKVIRLENEKNLYQTENNKLKEELQCIASIYDDNKTKLERYYNVIQRTYSVLQEVFSSNEIDIRQLADLCNEIGEICDEDFVSGNISTTSNNIVYNSFYDALNASEEKIAEIVEDGREQFPTLV
ncbi:hypothetical protein C2G38_2035638 [Gigaspora rosea]|uniref:Uncharacterized protein n=1 Tax=Gigaspora rosea TaxID=44941 RepID=A0A397VLC3_9GLOM|nr:hypothetical protein C2G38_2035638 [Gigaspora rosea]